MEKFNILQDNGNDHTFVVDEATITILKKEIGVGVIADPTGAFHVYNVRDCNAAYSILNDRLQSGLGSIFVEASFDVHLRDNSGEH